MKSFKQYVAEKVRGRKTKEIAGKDAAYMPGKSKQEIATARHYAAKKAGVSSFDAAGMTLAELEQKVAQVKSKRKRDWEKFEKDVAAGIDNLFKTGFFTVVKDGKATKIEGQSGFSAQQAGGPKQADVKVTHRLSDGTERSFYVECKYNYASANYFKFQVEVENGRFRYDPKFFEAGCSDEEKEEVRKLFAEIDLTGFFEELVQDDRVRSSWEFFQRQIKDIATFLKHDDKWKDFAEGLKQQYVFPRDLPAMANVFDLYVDEYESRYKGLLKKACGMISPAGVGDEAYEYYAKKLEHTSDDDEVHDAVESLWAHYDSDEAYVRVGPDGEREWVDISVSDPEEFESLVEQCHVIEGALNQTLVMMGKPAHAFGELRRLQPAEKLRYFFQVCVSTAKNEKTKWERFLTVKDAPGVMSVVRVDDYESRRLAGMISRYYETHGRCQYVQVQDCVFRLAESNALGLEGLPVFSDQVQKFYVDVHVSDDLRKMGLKIFAKEPDFDGKKYSFVESDANYVGKRHRPVFVKLG